MKRWEKHGLCGSRAYSSWTAMRFRCSNKNHMNYEKYGGRGIKVCKRWDSFVNFISDMGERPDGMQLDRIKTNGNYTPRNCRWATPRQNVNNRRNSAFIIANGIKKTISEWAEITGIGHSTLLYRKKIGWPHRLIISVPPKLGQAGESHLKAKLTEAQARRVKFGSEPLAPMARKWKISYSSLYGIRTGRTWKCLDSKKEVGPL